MRARKGNRAGKVIGGYREVLEAVKGMRDDYFAGAEVSGILKGLIRVADEAERMLATVPLRNCDVYDTGGEMCDAWSEYHKRFFKENDPASGKECVPFHDWLTMGVGKEG